MDSKNIKLKENKTDGSFASPRFSLTFKQSAASRQNSYEVLSALKGGGDILVEMNSSLLNMTVPERGPYALQFLDAVRDLGLDYKYRKVASAAGTQSLFAQLLGNKQTEAHEILAFIPDEIWERPDFYTILPEYGARYYITAEKADGSKLLEDMQQMLDDEKMRYFRMIVFDAAVFSYMGIGTGTLGAEDIKRLLGI